MADRTTPEPGERSFEDLLAAPLEQFGLPPELLACIMAYSTAPSGTVGAQPLQPAARLVCLPADEVERLRAELAESEQIRAKLKQTIDAFPDARDAANIAHARAQRDAALHSSTELGKANAEWQEAQSAALKRAFEAEAERDALNACIRATCSAARIAREVGDHRKVVLLSDVERLLTVPELPPLSPPDGDQ